MSSSPPAPPRQVALFITCLTDQFYPRVGVAITKILERFNCQVLFPPSQTCCGQPFFNNGFHADARTLAKRFIETFEPYEYIVTPSASCCAMVRENYPQLLAGDPAWSPGLSKVRSRTYEFVEFLTKVLKPNLANLSLPARQKITYHYSCHQRNIGLTTEALALLKSLGNIDFVPLEKSDQCCGFGGTFAAKYPAISSSIVEDKLNCIAATQAQTAVCNDAGCTLNIAGAAHRRQLPTHFKHLAELLAEAMGLETDQW